jgi:hypothetical protein
VGERRWLLARLLTGSHSKGAGRGPPVSGLREGKLVRGVRHSAHIHLSPELAICLDHEKLQLMLLVLGAIDAPSEGGPFGGRTRPRSPLH